MNLDDWTPLLVDLGFDDGVVMSLVQLCQQGVAGRCEANRLLYQWTQPKATDYKGYQRAVEVAMCSIRNAMDKVRCPPEHIQSFKAWAPGMTLGAFWQPLAEFIPMDQVEQVRRDWGVHGQAFNVPGPPPVPTPAAVTSLESMPHEVLSAQHPNGIWSTGWWQKPDWTWAWHWQWGSGPRR